MGLFMYKLFVAFILSTVCNDALNATTPERLAHMNAKLAQKLTKLELEKDAATPATMIEYEALFSTFRNRFGATITDVRTGLERTWKSIQQSSRKFIPALPTRANPQDMVMSLTNSGQYLTALIQPMFHSTVQSAAPICKHTRGKIQATSG